MAEYSASATPPSEDRRATQPATTSPACCQPVTATTSPAAQAKSSRSATPSHDEPELLGRPDRAPARARISVAEVPTAPTSVPAWQGGRQPPRDVTTGGSGRMAPRP